MTEAIVLVHAPYRLDKGGKGFLTTTDWGNVNTYNVVQTFSHMYMRRFMGLPDISTPHEQVSANACTNVD
jgi:hypothetical protein